MIIYLHLSNRPFYNTEQVVSSVFIDRESEMTIIRRVRWLILVIAMVFFVITLHDLNRFNIFIGSNPLDFPFIILPLLLGYSFGASYLPVIIIAAIQSLLLATVLSILYDALKKLFR